MCGIAGIISFPTAPPKWRTETLDLRLQAMSAAIAHRGPDGRGEYLTPRVALLHRRLAIIDRAGGQQPMANETGDVHVIFNGEIYNHLELRRQLIQRGHHFKSDHSDTEVLVHGWEQWNTDLPSHLRGMFAFALWDARAQTLFLARDFAGEKPLFYAPLEDGLVFGSTIPSILAWPEVLRRVPREQIARYLQLGYFPPPQTVFRDISQIAPGHWLRLRRDVLDGQSYRPIPLPSSRPSPTARAEISLRHLIRDSVTSQLIADVPVACFLSGGIDSSIIATVMQEAVRQQGGGPIHTVSVGFSDARFDETAYAALVAKKIQSHHTRLEVSVGDQTIQTLDLLMQTSLGQPFADSSFLPTYHLSKAVRQIAPVALAGDGGDELFGGYDRYRALKLLARWSALTRHLPRSAPFGSLGKQERYRRLAAAAREMNPADRYTRLAEIASPDMVYALLGEWPAFEPCDQPLRPDHRASFRHALLRDQREYLPGDLLFKVDSASMASALEVREPFLDANLINFANALPDDDIIRGRQSKHILRQTFAQDLPPEILTRPKQGFGVPIGKWFRGNLRQPLNDLLRAPSSFAAAHLQKPAVETLLAEHEAQTRDHTHRLFALLMLELFWRAFKPTLN